jgi:tetratricopeptide (TPR) repeat protein
MTMTSPSNPLPLTRLPPCPQEKSDIDNDVINPAVLKPVMEDLCRFTDELGPNHVQVADMWNSLGLIRLHMQHNAPAAIKCHQEALKIYKMNKVSVLQLAVTLGDLGTCYERIGEEEQALIIYQEATQLLRGSDISSSLRMVHSIRRSVARLKRE